MRFNLLSALLARKSKSVPGHKRRTPSSTRLSCSVSTLTPRPFAGKKSVGFLFLYFVRIILNPCFLLSEPSQTGASEEEERPQAQATFCCFRSLPQQPLRPLNAFLWMIERACSRYMPVMRDMSTCCLIELSIAIVLCFRMQMPKYSRFFGGHSCFW